MSLTAVCCAEYPTGALEEEEGVLGGGCLFGAPDEEAEAVKDTLSFFLLEAAVGSLRLGLEPEIAFSLEVFPWSLDGFSWMVHTLLCARVFA